MNKHVMLDLEAAGNGPNGAIISIGAVIFDFNGLGKEFYRAVDLDSAIEMGGQIDSKTIKWWMNQSKEAQAVFNDPNAVTITQALMDFTDWFPKWGLVWGNGATFDNVLLRSAFRAHGTSGPWHFKDDRCFRTMKAMFHDVPCPQVEGAVYHNALDDAKVQALWAIEMMKRNPTMFDADFFKHRSR